jgi:Ca2+-transporting ATPase
VSLVLANLVLIVINLSWRKSIHKIFMSANKILFMVFSGALFCLPIILYVPFFADLFHMAPLNFKDLILIGAAVFVSLAWFEILKIISNKRLETID